MCFTPVTIQTSPQFFGLELPTNSNDIASGDFEISGNLTQIDTRWRTNSNSNYLFIGRTHYFKAPSSSDQLSSIYNEPWGTTWNISEPITHTFTVPKSVLTNSSRNYSRDNTQAPQFGIEGSFSNNVGRPVQTQEYPYSGPPNGPYTSYDFDLSGNPRLWWDYTWGTGTPWNGTTGIENKSGFFTITNNGSNVPYMLIPGASGTQSWPSQSSNTLPYNQPTVDLSSNLTRYNHTQSASYNQAIWCKDGYKALPSTASSVTDPYIDYASNYHEQTEDYTFPNDTQDTLTITYNQNIYFGSNASITKTWSNIKWLTFKIFNGATNNGNIRYEIKENNTSLILGTDFIIFIAEEQGSATYRGTYWSSSPVKRTPWMDGANRSSNAQPSQLSANLGEAANGAWQSTSSGTATTGGSYDLRTINKANLSTWQYFRIGVLNNKTITSISLTYF